MSYSGDAAEQVVRMSLETGEVAVRLAGSGAKQLAILIYAILREQKKTAGKARLTNMLRSGKELKVFAVKDSDLQLFCREAKKYGVLYCVLKDKYNKDGNVPIDIIARAEDASKIQRIFDRFELGNVDKGSIVANAEKSIAEREERVDEVPTKTRGERIVEEAMGDPVKKEGQSHENPTVAKTEKSPPSERSSEIGVTASDRGAAKQVDKKPSVREKLERYKAAAKADKEADRAEPALSKEKAKAPEPLRQTVHHQPKRTKKPKAR